MLAASSVESVHFVCFSSNALKILQRMSWSGGDWLCGACQHQNFKKRDACQRCGYPKFGGPDVSTYYRTEVMPGDWYCSTMNCGAHNFASRTTCHICGTMNGGFIGNVMVAEGAGGPPGWKPGDWMCTR